MFDQLMEGFRRASESSTRVQQDWWKSWSQPWMPGSMNAAAPPDWARGFSKRFTDLLIETLHKHRESLDTTYKVAISALEEALHATDAKNPEEYRRSTEEVWRKLFETFRTQYETQLQELQKLTTLSFDAAGQQPQA